MTITKFLEDFSRYIITIRRIFVESNAAMFEIATVHSHGILSLHSHMRKWQARRISREFVDLINLIFWRYEKPALYTQTVYVN